MGVVYIYLHLGGQKCKKATDPFLDVEVSVEILWEDVYPLTSRLPALSRRGQDRKLAGQFGLPFQKGLALYTRLGCPVGS